MNFKYYLFTLLFFSIITASCKKEVMETPAPTVTDMRVPAGFDWETSRNVNFKIGVSDTRFDDAIHLISIYKGDPTTGGVLLSTGAATINKPFESKIYIADTVSSVYIVKKAPDNSSSAEQVLVNALTIDLTIGQTSNSMKTAGKLASIKKMAVTVPTSPTAGCTRTEELDIWSFLSYIEVKNGQTVCVTGSNRTFNVRFGSGGGTVRITGQNLTLLTVDNNAGSSPIKIVVTASSSVSISPQINFNPTKDVFENYGNTTFSNSSSFGSPRTLINVGTLSLGEYFVKSGNTANTHINYGTITVRENMKVEPGNTLTNHGTLNLTKELLVDKASFNNHNRLNVGENVLVSNSSTFANTGNITASKELQISASTFNSEGNVSVAQNMIVQTLSSFLNKGTVNVNGELQVSVSSFINESNVTAAQNMLVSGLATFTNRGKLTATSDLTVNSLSQFINHCNLWVRRDLNVNHKFENYGFVKVEKGTSYQGISDFTLHNGSVFRTGTIILNRTIRGYGATSLLAVSAKSILNANIEGEIQYCAENGFNQQSKIRGNASLGCDLYIPATECNEGNGSAPKDADKDGVTDDLDAYPNDKDRAFNNYYPSGGANAGATLVFEDNWPKKGDYDMNDLAVSYRYQVVTNADNKVVDVIANYSLYATGGEYNNGFAVEFPVSATSVTSVKGGPKQEEGQTKAVVVVFKGMRDEMANWNTVPNAPVSPAKDYTFTLTLKDGPSLEQFGLGVYNPFIWNSSSKGRSGEIHLPGSKPTDLADKSLFGTQNDYSSEAQSRYYITSSGLPWALNIPVNKFNYPIERTQIADAYLKFGAWVQSGGTSYLDWYVNRAEGYRSEGNIYGVTN